MVGRKKRGASNRGRSYHPDQGAQQNSARPTLPFGSGPALLLLFSRAEAQVGRLVGSRDDVRTSSKCQCGWAATLNSLCSPVTHKVTRPLVYKTSQEMWNQTLNSEATQVISCGY